jgi:hypothetical protein
MANNSNQLVPSQAAVVTYVGSQIASGTTALTTGAASSTDNALVRFDGATGKVIQNGVITEDDVEGINWSFVLL